MQLDDQFIQQVLRPYFAPVDGELCEALRTYIVTLRLWNEKIALTTIADPVEILRLHFGESFFAASVAGMTKGRVADIGTGAGFPGIPFRMVLPSIAVTLIEPIAKKTAFLHEIVRKLALSDIDIIRCRMEDAPADVADLDYISARALGGYEELLVWSEMRLSQNGKVVLLVGEKEAAKLASSPRWRWDSPVKIPNSKSRLVLLGEKL
jgi:16S rRNA (guanine527-N7)-methyltransferase